MHLTWPGKRPPDASPADLTIDEVGGAGEATGRLDHGDNLAILASWRVDQAGGVDLIYLDPPFASGKQRRIGAGAASFADPAGGEPGDVLQPLYQRLWLCRELLADEGSLLLHCDHRLSPALALICDELFGRGDRGAKAHAPGFRNEIVWHYGLGGSSRRSYPKKHDVILWYTKASRWTFHAPLVPATSHRMKGQLKHQPDVWDLPSLNNQAHERTGYPTQKPLELLERLVSAHTDPGDLVADPYGGAGTTAIAARRLGRRWLTCDREAAAVEIARQRLLDEPDGGGWELRRAMDPPSPATARIVIETADSGRTLRLAGPDLDAVDNWSIGSGEPFRAYWHAARDRRTGQLTTEARLDSLSQSVRVRVVSRAGGCHYCAPGRADTEW